MEDFDSLSKDSQHRLMKDFIFNHADPDGDKFKAFLEQRNIIIE